MEGKEKGRGDGRILKKKGSPPVLPFLSGFHLPSQFMGSWGVGWGGHRASQGTELHAVRRNPFLLGSGDDNPRIQNTTPSLHFSLLGPQDRGGRIHKH